MSPRLAAVAAAAILGAASPTPAEPAPGARIVGTLRFLERGRPVTPAEATRILGGKRISLALRNGWDVAPARLDADGRFSADVAPGEWRLEWIDVGERQEVLATPVVVVATDGATGCAGRIEVAFSDVASELGASAAGTVRVEPGCDGASGQLATAAFAPDPFEPPFGFPEVAEGTRVEGFFADQQPGLRLSVAVPLRRPVAWIGNVVLVGGASRIFPTDGVTPSVDSLEVGAGFTPYWGAELTGGVRWDRGGDQGVAPWAGLRLGPAAYAFIARAELRDGVRWSLGLDVSAFHLLGRFL